MVAHNIEDASRSAGSYEIDENALDGLVKELGAVVKYGGEPDAHKKLELVILQHSYSSVNAVYR